MLFIRRLVEIAMGKDSLSSRQPQTSRMPWKSWMVENSKVPELPALPIHSQIFLEIGAVLARLLVGHTHQMTTTAVDLLVDIVLAAMVTVTGAPLAAVTMMRTVDAMVVHLPGTVCLSMTTLLHVEVASRIPIAAIIHLLTRMSMVTVDHPMTDLLPEIILQGTLVTQRTTVVDVTNDSRSGLPEYARHMFPALY